MPKSNALKDVTIMHNSQSKEMLVANDENVQYTNKQSREVHV